MSNTIRVNFANVKFRIKKSILCTRQHLMKPERQNYRLRQWVCFSNSYFSWAILLVHDLHFGYMELLNSLDLNLV